MELGCQKLETLYESVVALGRDGEPTEGVGRMGEIPLL